MINLNKIIKNFGLLEFLVTISLIYVLSTLIWTATTRSAVVEKANSIKLNHKNVVDLLNKQVNQCSQDINSKTLWGDNCNSSWNSKKIVQYLLNNIDLKNPYKLNKSLIQLSSDPRIQAEGKAGQSTDKGIIFVTLNDFSSEAGSEWIIGTCVKSPCVAAGNNELVSIYR